MINFKQMTSNTNTNKFNNALETIGNYKFEFKNTLSNNQTNNNKIENILTKENQNKKQDEIDLFKKINNNEQIQENNLCYNINNMFHKNHLLKELDLTNKSLYDSNKNLLDDKMNYSGCTNAENKSLERSKDCLIILYYLLTYVC